MQGNRKHNKEIMKDREKKPVIVLASASPRRAEMLKSLGLVFEVRPVSVDEIPLDGEQPEECVVRLARAKASIQSDDRDCLIIACDTVVVVDGAILGKPYDRDDAGKFLGEYLTQGIFPHDPFASLDWEGVGQVIRIGVYRGRGSKQNLKIGICGEHGGDPNSILFCHEVGLDYVSCSPYRVPIARLAAARAAVGAGSGEGD